MSRTLRIIVALVALQAAFAGAYFWVEGRRSPDRSSQRALGTAPPRPESKPMPALELRARDGTRRELREMHRATLVHFWATWCSPCRAELPGLLAVSEEHAIDVIAIALDPDWDEVERFLNGSPPKNMFLADPQEVTAAFGIRTLPITYLVDAESRLRLRFDGARDWGDAAFVTQWSQAMARQ